MVNSTDSASNSSLRLSIPRPLAQREEAVVARRDETAHHQGQDPLHAASEEVVDVGSDSASHVHRRRKRHSHRGHLGHRDRKLFRREPKEHFIARIRRTNRLELFRAPLWFFIPIGLAFFIGSLLLVYLLATVAFENVSTTPSLPTISAAGAIYPQYGIFAFTLTWVAAGLVVLFVFKYWQLKIVQRTLKLRRRWHRALSLLNLVILFAGVLSAVALSLVGIVSVEPNPNAHGTFTGIFLVSLILHIVLVMVADILFLILVRVKIRARRRRIESMRAYWAMQARPHLPEVDDENSMHLDIEDEGAGANTASRQDDIMSEQEQVEKHVERRDKYLPIGLIAYRLIVTILFSLSWIVLLLSLLGDSPAAETVFSVFEFIVVFFAMCFFGSYAYDFRVGFQTSVLIFERDVSMLTKRPFRRSIFAAKSVNTPASAIATPIPEMLSVQESMA